MCTPLFGTHQKHIFEGMAPIVTLTTDWGDRDYFAGRMKGGLFSLIPEVNVVDISHSQQQGEFAVTREIIRSACLSFPAGTIHIVDVGTDELAAGRPVALGIEYHDHIFLSCSVELMRRSFDADITQIVSLPVPEPRPTWTFLAYDLFCPVAQGLASGIPLDSIGDPYPNFTPIVPITSHSLDNGQSLWTHILHFDHYGNANLDLSYSEFERIREKRRFKIIVEGHNNYKGKDCTMDHLSRNYCDAGKGMWLLTVSQGGLLQLAVNQGSMRQMFGLDYNSMCEIRFFD